MVERPSSSTPTTPRRDTQSTGLSREFFMRKKICPHVRITFDYSYATMFCRIFFIGLQKNFLTQYSKNLIIQNHANDIEKNVFPLRLFYRRFPIPFFSFLVTTATTPSLTRSGTVAPVSSWPTSTPSCSTPASGPACGTTRTRQASTASVSPHMPVSCAIAAVTK